MEHWRLGEAPLKNESSVTGTSLGNPVLPLDGSNLMMALGFRPPTSCCLGKEAPSLRRSVHFICLQWPKASNGTPWWIWEVCSPYPSKSSSSHTSVFSWHRPASRMAPWITAARWWEATSRVSPDWSSRWAKVFSLVARCMVTRGTPTRVQAKSVRNHGLLMAASKPTWVG